MGPVQRSNRPGVAENSRASSPSPARGSRRGSNSRRTRGPWRSTALATAAALAALSGEAQAQDEDTKPPDATPNESGAARGSLAQGPDPATTETSKDPPGQEELAARRERAAKAKAKAKAKADAKPRASTDGPLSARAELLMGFGQAPRPGASPTGDGTAAVLAASGEYRVSQALALELLVPATFARIQEPGERVARFVLGNPVLAAEYAVPLNRTLALPLRLGVGVPIAQGEFDPTSSDVEAAREGRTNAYADAAHGYRHGERFVTERLPIVFSVGVEHDAAALVWFARSGLLVAPSIGGEIDNPDATGSGTWVQNSVALRSVTELGLDYVVLAEPELSVGLDLWLTLDAVHAVEFESAGSDIDRVQLVLEPHVAARFGWIEPTLGFLAPVGGLLGDTGMKSLRLGANFYF